MSEKTTMTRRGFMAALGAGAAAAALPVRGEDAVKIGALIPMSGPAGLFGPSCRSMGELAAEDINARGGNNGARAEVVFAEVGLPPAEATQAAMRLVLSDGVRALVGMHDSAVRNAVAGALGGRIPYIYTPTYEGGECSRGVFVLGETPSQQLAPAIPWLAENRGAKAWHLIGNDYVWPRNSNAAAKRFIAAAGGRVTGEEYLPFEADNFDAGIARIREAGAECVLITLVGAASVGFNRAFANFGLDKTTLRLGPLIEENTLAGIGAENSAGLFSSAGYFGNLETAQNRAFRARYFKRVGAEAPVLNALGESVYEGMLLLEALAKKAGSLETGAFERAAEGARYAGPRGEAVMSRRHVSRDIYLAEARGAEFSVAATFPAVDSGSTCA